jgi:alkylated DNA repair protein alkB family protein 8
MNYEDSHVHAVYDRISHDYSRTRVNVWPFVKSFIDSLKTNESLIDIGCGNGYNSEMRNDLNVTGIDQCSNFIEMCELKGLNVLKMNCCDLNFENKKFDNGISIAVFHHLSTKERRISALSEMIRVLKPDGSGLISLWSVENQRKHKFVKGDNIVNWTLPSGVKYERYYYIFDELLVNEYLSSFSKLITVQSITNERGNWFIVFKKI